MKKILFTVVIAVALCFYVSGASALTLEFVGSVADSGTGFGDVSNILTLQKNGSETGSVSWSGTDRVLSGDAKNTSKVWLFSDIIATGITGANQLGIVYNVNQEGKDSALNTEIGSLTLQVFTEGVAGKADGTQVFDSDMIGFVGKTGGEYPPVAQGTGGAGYLFNPDDAIDAALAVFFADPDHYYLGASGTINSSNDGPDNIFFAKITGVTLVPEPFTMLLLGLGLVGLAGVRRFKK
jgi:hypothetical protein